MSFDGEKDPKDIIRDELRAKLRAKIGEDRIKRSSKKQKDEILKTTLKDMGIDKEQMQKDMEAVKKQGGFTMTLNK
jgi:hypothetical protein